MIKEKKNPKVTVNGATVSGSTIVYGDLVETEAVAVEDINLDGQMEFGCEHGRRIGQPCPHCLGIGAASPKALDKVIEECTDEVVEDLKRDSKKR